MGKQGNRDARPLVALAIDDDPDDVSILSHHLGRIPDVEIELLAFVDPERGLAELGRREVDVVLLDYRLGSRTGVDVFDEIQGRGIDVPTILITDHGDEQVAVDALHGGFADYLPKGALSAKSLRRSLLNAIEKFALRRSLVEHRENLERAVKDLSARNAEIQTFYHSLSHELKTPLTAIREFVSIVLDGLQGPLNSDQRDSLGRAKRACDHVVACINDILDASRLETGKLSIQRRIQPVVPVVEQAIAQSSHRAQEKGIELRCRSMAGAGEAWFDEHRILQVLTNLIDNALKFTERGGEVEIQVAAENGDTMAVSVRDSGRGIPAEEQERIFDRLFQSSGEDAALSGGMGLGLNLCRELITLHQGRIVVESELGRGSRFTFTIPRSSDSSLEGSVGGKA